MEGMPWNILLLLISLCRLLKPLITVLLLCCVNWTFKCHQPRVKCQHTLDLKGAQPLRGISEIKHVSREDTCH